MMEKLNWTQAQLITQFTRDWQLEWWERMAGGVAWSNKGTGKYILKKIHIDYINKEEKKRDFCAQYYTDYSYIYSFGVKVWENTLS